MGEQSGVLTLQALPPGAVHSWKHFPCWATMVLRGRQAVEHEPSRCIPRVHSPPTTHSVLSTFASSPNNSSNSFRLLVYPPGKFSWTPKRKKL